MSDVAQVIVYDHRGQGRSDRRTADEWNPDTWADDVVRLCDALGIEKPIVLGNSFGGFVAQRYIGRHPDHPAAVAGEHVRAGGDGPHSRTLRSLERRRASHGGPPTGD